MDGFDLERHIRALKLLKTDIEKRIQAVKDAEDRLYLGTGNQKAVDARKKELEDFFNAIDKNIIDHADVSAALIAKGSADLEKVIKDLTSQAMRDSLQSVGLTRMSKTARTMDQLEEFQTDPDKKYEFDSFDVRKQKAEELVKKSKKYEKYQEISGKMGGKKLSEDVEVFQTEAEGSIAFIEKYEAARSFMDTTAKKLSGKGQPEEWQGAFYKEMGRDKPLQPETVELWKKLTEYLTTLKDTEFDKEFDIGGGRKVKLSELSPDLSTYFPETGDRASVEKMKKMLETISSNKFKKAVKGFLGKKISYEYNTLKTIVVKHPSLEAIGTKDANGYSTTILDELKRALGTKDIARIRALAAESVNSKTFLDELHTADPKEFARAKELLVELQRREAMGYDGTQPKEPEAIEISGKSLGLVDGKTISAVGENGEKIDFNKIDSEEKMESAINILLEQNYTNGDIVVKKAMERRALDAAMTAGMPVPREIPILSSIPHLFGRQNKKDRFVQGMVRTMMKESVTSAVAEAQGKTGEYKRVKNAWELDEADKKKFRDAERRIIVENKGQLSAAQVKRQAMLDEQGR